ncbi:MAG: conjugative transposon protein TraM [Flavobacterium sp.]|nr:MAG: conjugative transposon protein TraM [Flavobacterium sp.]
MTEKKKKLSTRQLLMVLPLPVIGILAFAFHALGGGSGKQVQRAASNGINTSLPDARLAKDEPADKMAYYDQASRDSAGKQEKGLTQVAEKLGFQSGEDPQTQQINAKLAAINREINTPYVAPKSYSTFKSSPAALATGQANALLSNDVAKLEALMKNMKAGEQVEDPEMAQLNAMMDKLIAVQNPELAKQLYKKPEGTSGNSDTLFKAIPALIASNQKARQGSVVELRLLDTIVLNGVKIPKGHLIYGLASFSNQRLNLEIKNIRLGNQVIPVNLTVYDKRDAMVGINAPEAILSDALGTGASDAAGSFGISGIDLTTQIAGAGIDAAKSLFNKKIKRVKQKLTAGYPLLLKDNSKSTQ